jgi:hypothetical protein
MIRKIARKAIIMAGCPPEQYCLGGLSMLTALLRQCDCQVHVGELVNQLHLQIVQKRHAG